MSTFSKTVKVPGTGPTPQPRQHVTVSADLYLADSMKGIWSTHKASGYLFSATNGAQPFTYQVGVGAVVKGWEDGVASMQVGEEARLTIPWKYGYGEKGHSAFQIGPKADLVFDIKVFEIK